MISQADELVLRTARLLWRMGYFVRTNVPLSAYNPYSETPDRRDITDLDVLGLRWDADYQPDSIACECKSGSSVKPIDRVFWLKGVMSYFGVRKGYLVVPRSGPIACSIGGKVGVILIDEELLAAWERQFNIDVSEWHGSISPRNQNLRRSRLENSKRITKPEINYLRWTYWEEPAYSQIKKLLKLGESIAKKSSKVPKETSSWILLESLILFSSSLASFSGQFITSLNRDLPSEVAPGLFGGYMTRTERQNMIDNMYKFLESYIRTQYKDTLPFTSKQLRTLEPPYFENLVSLIERVINSHIHGAVPRFLDLVSYEFLLDGLKIQSSVAKSHFVGFDIDYLSKATKNIVNFYLETTGNERSLYEPLFSL